MAAILAQMRGDAGGAGLDRDQCSPHGIGTRARARIAQGSYVIDIDAETQRRSFGHSHLSREGRGRSRSAARASGEGTLRAPGLAARPLTRRASDDARRPLPCGERSLSVAATRIMIYPLTRSTRATTALARNWAIMALRCFRS